MRMARDRALTQHPEYPLPYTICHVEMRKARDRALTPVNRGARVTVFKNVEMRVARDRALTHVILGPLHEQHDGWNRNEESPT